MKSYKVSYADGRPATCHPTLAKAKSEVRHSTGAKIIEDFADRTIAWMTEAAAKDDDGRRAVASIWECEEGD